MTWKRTPFAELNCPNGFGQKGISKSIESETCGSTICQTVGGSFILSASARLKLLQSFWNGLTTKNTKESLDMGKKAVKKPKAKE